MPRAFTVVASAVNSRRIVKEMPTQGLGMDEQRLAAADGEGLALRPGQQRAEEPVGPDDPPIEDGRVGIDANLG